ncbi:MAG: hypothetical protein JWN82_364 [Candidatus Saccharibacteria bacterium]|nr:hypothetical protein [Candidatus Saccharibacteria bacterium]
MRLWIVLAVFLLSLTRSLSASGTSLANAPDIPWAQPRAMALNNTGPVAVAETEHSYACTAMAFRLIDDLSKRLRQGCFVQSAIGLIDPDQSVAIFTGTDEGELIKFGGQSAALSILPYSASVGRFGGFPGMGTYMYLYTYFPGALQSEGIPQYGRYKSVVSQPNFVVTDEAGQPLPVNSQALGYAPRGQWMVTESPGNALVRINLADFSILPFGKSFDTPGMPFAGHTASLAVTGDGRYAAVASTEFSSFKVYDLAACTTPKACPAHDYWQYVKTQIGSNLSRISQVSFVRDDLISFNATNGSQTNSYLLAPSGQITSLLPYLGLGDSYASGQGAWNYLAGTDTAVNHCHQSAHSYPLRLDGRSVACSGARSRDIINQSANYSGQVSDHRSAKSREADGSETSILHDFTPGYLAQQAFVTAYQPGVITIQIGGNDVGFKDMLLRCVSPGDCYQTYEDRLEAEQTIAHNYSKWVDLFRQLQKTAPAARLYALGYPQIVTTGGKCGLNVHLTPGDIDFARQVTAYINGVIQKAAAAAGVQYVDVSSALAGYELCSSAAGNVAVNGVTAGNDTLGVLGQESFHPTAFGHELIEQAIRRATHNFANTPKLASNPGQAVPAPSGSDPLLQAPRSGRPVKTISPASGMTSSGVKGGSVTIDLVGADYGLRPNTTYTVQIGQTTTSPAQTDSQGDIQTTVPIPPAVNPGIQPVVVSGLSQGEDPVTITDTTYVGHSPTDYDGDDVPNPQDSCPLVVNSGSDDDHDNLDDTCDSEFTLPTSKHSSAADAGGGLLKLSVQHIMNAAHFGPTKNDNSAPQTAVLSAATATPHYGGTRGQYYTWLLLLLVLVIMLLVVCWMRRRGDRG